MHLEGGCQVTDVVSGCKLVIRSTHLWTCAGSATRTCGDRHRLPTQTWTNASAERVVGAAVFVIDNHGSSAAVAKQRPRIKSPGGKRQAGPAPTAFSEPSSTPMLQTKHSTRHAELPLTVRQIPPVLSPAVFASSASLFTLHYLNS